MCTVYLLLRNNQQSGPYTIEELQLRKLKPTDLIWIEGKNGGWQHPTEIEYLKPLITTEESVKEKKNADINPVAAPKNTEPQQSLPTQTTKLPSSENRISKNIYVSLPGSNHIQMKEDAHNVVHENLEDKAEAIRKRVFSAMKSDKNPAKEISTTTDYELETKYSKNLEDIRDDYAAWLYTQQIDKKKKARRRKTILAASSIIVLFTLIGIALIKGASKKTEPAYSQKQEQYDKREKTTQEKNQPEIINRSITDSVHNTNYHTDAVALPTKKEVTKIKKDTPLLPSNNVKPDETVAHTEIKPDKNIEISQNNGDEKGSVIDSSVSKKKDSFDKRVKNFFARLMNKEKNSSTRSNQEKTVRTDTVQNSQENLQTIDLANDINITTNASVNNWMLGVQGLKLTLHNNSSEVLKKAAVEVRYYNEQRNLLEKRTVYFNNVSPNKSQTIAAPDYRLADYADYQLLSAIGNE